MLINPIINYKNINQDSYSILFSHRIIFITGEINDELASSIISQLIILDNISHDEISLYISSIGGSVSAALSIIDTMDYISSDIRTISIGLVASAATLIATSGTKGKRYSLKNTDFMIHQPSTGVSGSCKDISITANRIEEIKNRIYKLLASRTGQNIKTIEKHCERDYYLSSQSAFEYGLIDQIIERKEQ